MNDLKMTICSECGCEIAKSVDLWCHNCGCPIDFQNNIKNNVRTNVNKKSEEMINISQLYVQYPDCMTSKDRFRAYLMDLYPRHKAEANIHLSIYESGILKDLENNRFADELDLDIFCFKLTKQYGIKLELVKKCIYEWITLFKEN